MVPRKSFNCGESYHVSDIVMVDETWIYQSDPEIKCQSSVWVFPDDQPPLRVKRSRSAELVRLLKTFTTEELVLKILPDLKFLEWDKLKKGIVDKKLSMSKESISNRIADKLWRLEDRYKIEILDQLYISALILHSSRYKWQAIQMTGGEQTYLSSNELQSSIKRQLLREGTRGEVTVKLEADMHWIRIVEKKLVRDRGIVSQKPVCAAVAIGQNYMFVLSTGSKEYIVMSIIRALGRTNMKNCKLTGKDIKSLLRLLKAKEAKASSANTVLQVPQYKPAKPKRSVEGVDFTQSKSRKDYCTEIFVDDENEMPQLEEMVLQVEGIGWNVEHIVPEMEGKPFSLEVNFRSTSIAQMFTEMAELGVMSTPLPEYARRLPTLGRNIVQLRSQ